MPYSQIVISPVSCCLHMCVKLQNGRKAAPLLFPQMVRGQRNNIPSQATFVTLSRALCSNGILALFGIAQMPAVSQLSPSVTDSVQREEMIDRFKIPRNACMSAEKAFIL